MSMRSKREPKPTIKLLSYLKESGEVSKKTSPGNTSAKSSTPKAKPAKKNDSTPVSPAPKVAPRSGRAKASSGNVKPNSNTPKGTEKTKVEVAKNNPESKTRSSLTSFSTPNLDECFEGLSRDLSITHSPKTPNKRSNKEANSTESPPKKQKTLPSPVQRSSRSKPASQTPETPSTSRNLTFSTRKVVIKSPAANRKPVKVINVNSPAKKVTKVVTLQRKKDKTEINNLKDTLKQFLIMGTKVANAISEALKNKDEVLLSQFSSFEKRCLSLVYSIAEEGGDLNIKERDKLQNMLEEQLRERKLYRETFMESLRISHMSNLALYTQMLQILKTF